MYSVAIPLTVYTPIEYDPSRKTRPTWSHANEHTRRRTMGSFLSPPRKDPQAQLRRLAELLARETAAQAHETAKLATRAGRLAAMANHLEHTITPEDQDAP